MTLWNNHSYDRNTSVVVKATNVGNKLSISVGKILDIVKTSNDLVRCPDDHWFELYNEEKGLQSKFGPSYTK